MSTPPEHILLRRQTDAISDRHLAFLERALAIQLREVSEAYGLETPGVTLVTPETHLPSGEAVAIDFVDSDGLPEGSAHHGWNPGAAFAWALVGVKEARSWTVAASHEALEYRLNMKLDRWIAEADEAAYWAMEICDPVQGDAYEQPVELFGERKAPALSNYVLPSFWERDSRGPWDRMGLLKGPFSLSEGGYAIVERPDAQRTRIGARALRDSGPNPRATSRSNWLLRPPKP